MANINALSKQITDAILDSLKNGVNPWEKCFQTFGKEGYVSHATGRSYSLNNIIWLWAQGNESGEFWTFNCAKKEGHMVKKGSKASYVIRPYTFNKNYKDSSKDEEMVTIFKTMALFHWSCIEGSGYEESKNLKNDFTIEESCQKAADIIEAYFNGNGKNITKETADSTPCYKPITDAVSMPPEDRFTTQAEYYRTYFHELCHSTGHKDRLNRKESSTKLDRGADYGYEELVAEMGAAYLSAYCELPETENSISNSAAYCKSWLQTLQNNPEWILKASKEATRAVEYILGEKAEREENEN